MEVGRVPLIERSWALARELYVQRRWGGYAATTLWGCATRKYHSYLSLWQSGTRYEILPQMEEEVRLAEGLFRLSTQFWRGQLSWEGFRYLEGFQDQPHWIWRYRVGLLTVEKGLYLDPEAPVWQLYYRFLGKGFPVLFRWTPLWAVRPWHALRRHYEKAPVLHSEGRLELPEVGVTLYLQVRPLPRYVPWLYLYEAITYPEEARRGYEDTEDLQATQVWEWNLHEPGEVRIQLSLEPISSFWPLPEQKAPLESSFQETLVRCAENFFLKEGGRLYILAGHPWFGVWGRDTFISLPGLTLALESPSRFEAVCDSYLAHQVEGRFPDTIPGEPAAEDVGLWWLWALMQYHRCMGEAERLWRRYGEAIQQVLLSYLQRLAGEDGLLRVLAQPLPSWMDALVEGRPAVYRTGALVELNALWYAALQWVSQTAPSEGIRWRWGLLARRVLASFKPTFWQKSRGYLADWVDGEAASWQIRPNQLWAAAVPYRPISEKIAELVVDTVEKHLLTPRGLRTLSPADPAYRGTYEGSQPERDLAYHNGTVWPFLLGAYADARLSLYGQRAAPDLQKLVEGFSEVLFAYGWGAVAEIYDGDAPHAPKGAPLQAWSVAELLRILYLSNRCGSSC